MNPYQKKSVHALFAVIVFFPVNYYYLYFFTVTILSFLILFFTEKIRYNKKFVPIASFVIFYFLFGSVIRFYYFNHDDARDLIEIGRFVPVLILIMFATEFAKLSFSYFLKTLKLYILIDFFISFLQYNEFKSSFLRLIETIYSSPTQIELSLGISHRTIGLSTGPGDHGLVVLLMFSIIFIAYIKDTKASLSNMLIMLLALYSIFTSQSQTAFIGLIILHVLVFSYFLFKKKNKKIFLYYFIFAYFLTSTVIIVYIEELNYLFSLFEQGLERSSYTGRVAKKGVLLDLAFTSNLGFFFGWGKSFFGQMSTAMDNEHLYILLVYGPIAYLFFIIYIIKLALLSIKTNNLYKQIFICLMILGLPMAWPSTYYLSSKIMFILTIFYINFYRSNNEAIPTR